jgi:AraC family transcriptional regulator of arabinose operon
MGRIDDYCPPAAPVFGGIFTHAVGNCWRARGLRDYVLMAVTGGCCRVGWPGGQLLVSPRQLVLLAPGVAHDYGAADPPGFWAVTWVVFAAPPRWLDYLQWPGPRPGIGHLPLDDPEGQLFWSVVLGQLERAVALSVAGLPNQQLLAMNAVEGALLWCQNVSGISVTDPRLRRVIAAVCQDLRRPWRLAGLARLAGISPPHFTRLFRGHLGTSPQRFIEDRRLSRACELLAATPLPVQAVAEACGFASAFYFSSRFSRRFGCPPRAWRERPRVGAP